MCLGAGGRATSRLGNIKGLGNIKAGPFLLGRPSSIPAETGQGDSIWAGTLSRTDDARQSPRSEPGAGAG